MIKCREMKTESNITIKKHQRTDILVLDVPSRFTLQLCLVIRFLRKVLDEHFLLRRETSASVLVLVLGERGAGAGTGT